MIIVTGAAGFIASYLVGYLNEKGHENLILVDNFSREDKVANYADKKYIQKIDRTDFSCWLRNNQEKIDIVFHLGARTDTTEMSVELFNELNLNYSKEIWTICSEKQIPLVYASSAATYGGGEFGYDDSHEVISKLKPLNPYGESKNDFDKWVLTQTKTPPFWAGLKFFNVYGPNEYHKGRMASVIFHTFKQIKENGKMNLFRSHNPNFSDGGQLRDFVYVKDVASVCEYLMNEKPQSAIYNLGSGKARTFLDLATLTFKALNLEPNIEFIDTPIDIRDKYQYFTEANMSKLIESGYSQPFYSLEEGVTDYVKNFLVPRFK
jgi:ADP-L-glycero-D-manno-heptose 6-epimerase